MPQKGYRPNVRRRRARVHGHHPSARARVRGLGPFTQGPWWAGAWTWRGAPVLGFGLLLAQWFRQRRQMREGF